jgi:hypothetical protein
MYLRGIKNVIIFIELCVFHKSKKYIRSYLCAEKFVLQSSGNNLELIPLPCPHTLTPAPLSTRGPKGQKLSPATERMRAEFVGPFRSHGRNLQTIEHRLRIVPCV